MRKQTKSRKPTGLKKATPVQTSDERKASGVEADGNVRRQTRNLFASDVRQG